MYFKYILFLAATLAVPSEATIATSLGSGAQSDCAKEQFKCANGKCIPDTEQCDGNQQCRDGSDELNCTNCAENAFNCGDGTCINRGSVCDMYEDCDNGSDENNCTNHVCGSEEFRCQSGQCIDKRGRCNARIHCADKSDEENCLECFGSSWELTGNLFKCVSNNKCIFEHQLCNSIKNCPDGSDEDNTTCQNLQCAGDQVQCGAGHCVRRDEICNGHDPCGEDHKIEKANYNCTVCDSNMFKCKAEDKCIHISRLCDEVPDCEDRSDESESTCSVLECEPEEFQCQSGQCVFNRYKHTLVCNGHHDCKDESDKSDEANCTTCSPQAYKCGSGECVHKLKLCNTIAECSDGSDENKINCPNGSTPPVLTVLWRVNSAPRNPNVTLQHLTNDMAVYYDNSVSPSVTWPFFPLSQAWKYAKETFELTTLSDPTSQFLYVVLGKLKYNHQNHFSFRSWESGYRNLIDIRIREKNGWATENSANFEHLISGLGNIVKIAMEGVENIADIKLCDNTLRNIVFYDIYIHVKGQGSADVVHWRSNQFNLTLGLGEYNCFRDWFLPVYEKYGGSNVLKNYFHIFKRTWPKKLGKYSKFTYYIHKQLNVGEFVHFWSGAAGEDLRYLAKSAFNNWDDVFMGQFAKAQTDFPDIKYSAGFTGDKFSTLNIFFLIATCVLVIVFIALVIKTKLPQIRKKYASLVNEYW